MEITNEYYYELGQSLLNSWDNKSKFTTRNFDKVLSLVKEYEIRKPEEMKMDLACLDAAQEIKTMSKTRKAANLNLDGNDITETARMKYTRNNFERIKKALNADIAQ